MRQFLAILALFTLAACSGGDKTDTDVSGDDDDDTVVGDDDDDDDSCAISVAGSVPAEGDQDAFYKQNVRFILSAADATASISVSEDGGAEVSGSSSVNSAGTLVTWEGDDFAPGTDYVATLTYSCGSATASFTTSSTGAPADSPVNIVYDLGLTSGQWILPDPSVGAIIGGLIPADFELLVMPTSADTEISMLGALGTGADAQDECTPSLPFPPATFDNPYFSITSPALPIAVDDFAITIEDLDLSGAFSPDASRIQGASLQGTVDTRPLVELIAPGGEDNAVCDLLVTFNVACNECGDGSGPYCISIWVDSLSADSVGAPALVEITPEDVAANGACQ